MPNRFRGSFSKFVLALTAAMTLVSGRPAAASIIWNGPTTTFTKLDFADPALAANQDRLTPNVWITRGSSQGIYNAKTELGFTHFLSPADTLWADGTLANYAGLTYTDWNTWSDGVHPGPPSTIGVDAVVHLVSEDIYLSIRFTGWSSLASGGGFSYQRSTAPVPGPASLPALGVVGLVSARRRRA